MMSGTCALLTPPRRTSHWPTIRGVTTGDTFLGMAPVTRAELRSISGSLGRLRSLTRPARRTQEMPGSRESSSRTSGSNLSACTCSAQVKVRPECRKSATASCLPGRRRRSASNRCLPLAAGMAKPPRCPVESSRVELGLRRDRRNQNTSPDLPVQRPVGAAPSPGPKPAAARQRTKSPLFCVRLLPDNARQCRLSATPRKRRANIGRNFPASCIAAWELDRCIRFENAVDTVRNCRCER
jgi:hypothetical protein